jgi:cytochrome c oxidase assembly protein subunit 15
MLSGATALSAWLARRPVRGTASAFAPSLLPIAAGYLVAHYWSLWVWEGTNGLAKLSDPLGTGANWLGTAQVTPPNALIAPGLVAVIQLVAIVTGHLLGGMGLLALLALQAPAPADGAARALRDRWALGLAVVVLGAQIALGGWVSTNYAVLACTGFPQCNGSWWPAMHWSEGFSFAHELGRRPDGEPISMAALVAIQWAHRLFAFAVLAALAWLVARLWHRGGPARRRGLVIAGLALAQVASGLTNVVLGWPMLAALAHTAGAAALVVCLGREAAAALKSRSRILPS